jgi:hypothetical protein
MTVLKQVVLGFIILFLFGCSGRGEHMSTWMGVDHGTLINELGQPHRAYQGQFGLVQSWYRNTEDKIGCTDDFTVNNGVVTSFASDCGAFGGWRVPTYEP